MASTQRALAPSAQAAPMSAAARELLRQLADRHEPPKPEPFRALRWRRRRETHRCYMEFAHHRQGCQ